MKLLPLFTKSKFKFSKIIHQTLDYQEYTNSMIAIRDYRYKSKVETFIDITDLVIVEPISYPNLDLIFANRYTNLINCQIKLINNKTFMIIKENEHSYFGISHDTFVKIVKTYNVVSSDIADWFASDSYSTIRYREDDMIDILIAMERLPLENNNE